MGCCVSTSQINLSPHKVPDNIILLSSSCSPSTVEETKNIMKMAFCGTTEKAGEGALSWIFDGGVGSVDGDPSKPLVAPPTKERVDFMRFMIDFVATRSINHYAMYALKKDGDIVGGVCLLPPNDKDLHKPNMIEQIVISMRHTPIPLEAERGDSKIRLVATESVLNLLHKNNAHKPHWYVVAFAVDSTKQGKGYGKELMEAVNAIADHTGHELYLETFGPSNIRFYERNGYKVAEQMKVKDFDDMHGGVTAMVRVPLAGASQHPKKGKPMV